MATLMPPQSRVDSKRLYGRQSLDYLLPFYGKGLSTLLSGTLPPAPHPEIAEGKSLSEHLLSSSYLPGPVLGPLETGINMTDMSLPS